MVELEVKQHSHRLRVFFQNWNKALFQDFVSNKITFNQWKLRAYADPREDEK